MLPSKALLRHLRLAACELSASHAGPRAAPNLTPQTSALLSRPLQPRCESQQRMVSSYSRASSHSTTNQHIHTTSSPLQAASETPPAAPLNLQNHYTLFPSTIRSGSPPPSSPFAIPLPSLRREFLQLQARHHPDKFPPEQKTKAEALSSLINTAYKTLADPLLRAQYLLAEFHGVDVLAEDQGSAQQDPETLMEVMEAQEAIEGAAEEAEIEALKMENKQRIEDTVSKLGSAIDGGDIESARKACIRLRFWRSLQEGLEAWEPGKEVRLIH